MTERIICLIIGYCFGMIQTSYLYGRTKGIDIREQGSGNAGTTNAMRTFGKKVGLITAFCDIAKCIVAVLIVRLIYGAGHSDIMPLLCIYTSAGVILGHNFPFYLQFRGGKGIAATAGMIIAFGDWRLILLGVICFFGFFVPTCYVSLGSLALSAEFLIGSVILGQMGAFGMSQELLIEMYIIIALLTLMAYVKHRGNISRLLHGTERKTYLFRKKPEGEA